MSKEKKPYDLDRRHYLDKCKKDGKTAMPFDKWVKLWNKKQEKKTAKESVTKKIEVKKPVAKKSPIKVDSKAVNMVDIHIGDLVRFIEFTDVQKIDFAFRIIQHVFNHTSDLDDDARAHACCD